MLRPSLIPFVAVFVAAAWALAMAVDGRFQGRQRTAIVIVNVLALIGALAWLLFQPAAT